MGNTICDRLFISFAEGSDIDNMWSAHSTEALGPWAYLCAAARDRILEKVKDHIDQEMLRFYHASQAHRYKHYESESTADIESLLPRIEPWIAQKYGLGEEATELKELRSLSKESTSCSLVTNEVIYITHLFFLYHSYLEKKRKEETTAKSALMKDVVQAASADLENGLNDKKKEGFVNFVVLYSLKQLTEFGESILVTKDLEKFQKFSMKTSSIIKNLDPEEKPKAQDVALTLQLENLVKTVLKVLSAYKDYAPSADIDYLMSDYSKLTFFVGKLSLHLNTIAGLLHEDLYLELSGNFCAQETKKPDDFSLFKLDTKNTGAGQEIELLSEHTGDKELVMVVDPTKILIKGNGKQAVYSRRPNIGLFPIELSGSASSNQDYYYCSGEIWTVITHEDGSETHRPFRAEEVKQPTEQPFEFTGAVYKLTVEKTLKDVANTYGLTPEELQTYSRKTWTYFSTDKDIRSLTHWIQEGFDIPTLFSITRYERKEGALVQVSEHLLNDGSQALKTLELKDKGIRADWYGDLVIIYNTKKEYVVFDAETGYRKQKLTNCDRAISGFDRTRSRILSLQNSTLAQTRFEVFTSYQFKSSASEAAPNPIQAYFENIMQHVYCVQWGAFNLEFQQVSEKAKLLFQANQVDCRDQTFSEILGLITTLEGRPDFELRDILGLGLFKILDTQLNVASRIQNSTKTDMKVASQENLIKLKKAIMAFKFSDKLAAHQQGIIHYLKLNILSNIISLLTKTKKLVDYLQLGELLFSNKRIYSQQDVSRFLSRLLQLKSKGFAQFDAYMNSLVTKVEEKIAIVCAAEATAFQTKTSLSEELRIQSTNLTTFFSVIVAYRTRMQEELVDKLCEISVRGVQTSLKAICEDLNSSHQKLGQEGYLMQYQIELFSSFTAFILSSVINFMSYGNIWPHMSETLSEMCKQVCAAVQTSMLARPPAATPVSGKDFVQETWVIKEAVGLISGSGEVDVSLPKYNRLKIGIKGADPLFDKVIVGCTLEYDAHNQGREKKITRSIIAPETVLTNDTPIIVDTNRVKIVLISQRREAAFDEDRTIELEVTGEDLALKQTTKLETLIKMCYHFVTHQLLTELRKLDEAKGVMQELPENVAISLESILGSPLFENGVQQAKFSKIDTPNIVVDPEPENEMSEKGTKDRHKEDLCIKGYHHILETLSLKHTEVEGLETLCKQLQTDAATKGMHATLLGELGLILVKSVFVTLLAHSGKLLSIQHTLNSQKPVAVDNELKKLWKECSKIRSIVRAYETDRQFVDIYRKLLLVISIEPSESWNEKYREVDASQPSQEKESINEGVFKMKMYLEELRRNNPGPSNTCNDLGEVLLRLLGLQITVEQIFEILNQRQKHFDLYGVALEMVLNRVRENPTNLHDALLMFNQIFRKSTSEMGNLTPDYAGLSRSSIGNRISQMRELFQGILGYMLQPPAGEEWDNEILLAVESFKWIWRGKEVDCIRVVDVAKIWKICSQRVKDQARFRSSLIDLCFVLLKFCIRKADDLKQEEDEEPVLTLTRSVSVVDENSMSSILNHNFTFLMQVMSENIKELDKTSQVMSSADYSEFLKKLPSDLATKEEYLERLLEASDNDQGKISKIETDNEEKIKLMAKTLEVEVEVFEEEPVEVTEPIQPEVAPIQPEIAPPTAEPVAETATQEPTVFSETKVEKVQTKKLIKKEVENPDYQKFKSATAKLDDAQKDYLRNHRQRVNEIQKVLVMFNYYLLEAPDMAALFFDDGPNLEALTQIAFGHYPDSIVVPALRIIQKLMEVLPHHSALSPESGRLGSIFDVLLDHFAALFKPLKSFKRLDHELANSYLEFLRKIMFMPQHQQALISLIKIKCLESTSGPGLLVALALLDHSFGAPLPGSLVYDKLDLMKEQLLVLDKTTNLVAKAYLRDILHYRYDITTDETVSPVRIDRRHLLSSHVLTVCLRTKNYGFLPYHQVARFDPHGLNEQIGKYVDELDLISRVMKLNNNDSGLLAKFQLVKSLRLTQEKKYRQVVQTLLESIPAIKDKGVSEDDCSYEMNLWLNKCIESPTDKLPALSTQVLKRVSLHDSLRQKTFGVLSALGKLKQEPVSYWGTQFGYFGASGSSQTRNFNIAHHKPSLNSSLDFRPFLSTGRSGATDLLVQGIRHAALLYMFSTRQPADLPKLLLDLSTRLCMIEHKNSNLVEVRDLSTCLNLLLEESENKVLADQVTALAERRFDIDELPAVHLLLNKISKKLRTIEVSKTYFYRLFDDACQLTALLEEIEQNNKWVALYVETLENAAELSRLIPKNNLTLDTNRSSKFEAFLTRIEIPHLADSGSFKRLHKQEYVANIMLHFARYVVELVDPAEFSGFKLSPNLLRFLECERTIKDCKDYEEKLSPEGLEKFLTSLNPENKAPLDRVFKTLILGIFEEMYQKKMLSTEEEYAKYSYSINSNQMKLPLNPELMSKYSHWMIWPNESISGKHFGFCIKSMLKTSESLSPQSLKATIKTRLFGYQPNSHEEFYKLETDPASKYFLVRGCPSTLFLKKFENSHCETALHQFLQNKLIRENRQLRSDELCIISDDLFVLGTTLHTMRTDSEDTRIIELDHGVTGASFYNNDSWKASYCKPDTNQLCVIISDLYDASHLPLLPNWMPSIWNDNAVIVIELPLAPRLSHSLFLTEGIIGAFHTDGSLTLYWNRAEPEHLSLAAFSSFFDPDCARQDHSKFGEANESRLRYFKHKADRLVYAAVFEKDKGVDQLDNFVLVFHSAKGIRLCFKWTEELKDESEKTAEVLIPDAVVKKAYKDLNRLFVLTTTGDLFVMSTGKQFMYMYSIPQKLEKPSSRPEILFLLNKVNVDQKVVDFLPKDEQYLYLLVDVGDGIVDLVRMKENVPEKSETEAKNAEFGFTFDPEHDCEILGIPWPVDTKQKGPVSFIDRAENCKSNVIGIIGNAYKDEFPEFTDKNHLANAYLPALGSYPILLNYETVANRLRRAATNLTDFDHLLNTDGPKAAVLLFRPFKSPSDDVFWQIGKALKHLSTQLEGSPSETKADAPKTEGSPDPASEANSGWEKPEPDTTLVAKVVSDSQVSQQQLQRKLLRITTTLSVVPITSLAAEQLDYLNTLAIVAVLHPHNLPYYELEPEVKIITDLLTAETCIVEDDEIKQNKPMPFEVFVSPHLSQLPEHELKSFLHEHKEVWYLTAVELTTCDKVYFKDVKHILDAGGTRKKRALASPRDFFWEKELTNSSFANDYIEGKKYKEDNHKELVQNVYFYYKVLSYSTIRVLNYSPAYYRRMIDIGFMERNEKSIIRLFENSLRMGNGMRGKTVNLDRLRSESMTSLKRQNFSHLNQLIYELVHGIPSTFNSPNNRFHGFYNNIRMEFVNESSLLSYSSWKRWWRTAQTVSR